MMNQCSSIKNKRSLINNKHTWEALRFFDLDDNTGSYGSLDIIPHILKLTEVEKLEDERWERYLLLSHIQTEIR